MSEEFINDIPEVNHHPDTHKSEKYKRLKSDILSPHITNITIEGAIRGSKDVSALDIYSLLLMLTPDKLHLVTGTSESHAMETVYEADGFGLKYLIPTGKMIRDSKSNKSKFVFRDFYGRRKEVLFYGNVKHNDYTKFKGISCGTHYANEATLQNTAGLKFAEGRTVSAKFRKIIHTQNPTAPASTYYTDYEEPKTADKDRALEIMKKAEKYKDKYKQILMVYAKKQKDLKVKEVRKFLKEKGVLHYNKLTDKQKENLRQRILSKKYELIHERENELNEKYKISSAYYIFRPEYDNPNEVRNGLHFRYYHYTMEDNPTITEKRRQEMHDAENKASVYYKRDFLGLRSVAEDAIYDNLTEENFYKTFLPTNLTTFYSYKKPNGYTDNFLRYLAIDYGIRDNFVILDILFDPVTYTAFVEDEVRYIMEKDPRRRPATDKVYIEYLQKLLEKRESGTYAAIIVDPAARPFINSLIAAGYYAKAGRNTVKGKKEKLTRDKTESDKTVDRAIGGINLVKNAFDYRKIYINDRNCLKLRQELESYRLDPDKKKLNLEVPLKVNDHGADALRYFVNTVIRDIRKVRFNPGERYDILEKIDLARDTSLNNAKYVPLNMNKGVYNHE